MFKTLEFPGGFAPLAPLPGLCPGPTGGRLRPPDPSPNNFAPPISNSWLRPWCCMLTFSLTLILCTLHDDMIYPACRGQMIRWSNFIAPHLLWHGASVFPPSYLTTSNEDMFQLGSPRDENVSYLTKWFQFINFEHNLSLTNKFYW